MSNLPASRAESAGVLIAPEVIGSLGVAPGTNGSPVGTPWRTMQPDQGQINNFYRNIATRAPSPISVERQELAPEIVGASAMPSLAMDLTSDLLQQVGEGMVLAKAAHPGGTATSYFEPTARTTTAFTVPANGALQAGTLLTALGWLNNPNGTLLVVGASSTGTSIPVASGVAETVSGYLATLQVAGFRGATADITLDANGNLTSSAADFTTMGLAPGMAIYVGGVPGTAFAFATSGYGGVALIVSVAAHLITLKRRAWTVAAADPGTGKTIDLYWGRWLRNVSTVHASYQEQPYALELSLSSISAGSPEYVYGQGMHVANFDVDAPLGGLVKATLNFLGTDVTDPTASRTTGPSLAPVPLATERFNSATKEPYVQFLIAATEVSVASDIQGWKLSFSNGVTGQEQHGKVGPKRIIVGKVACSLTTDLVVTQDDAIKACTANTTLSFGSLLRNGNGGVFVDLPAGKFTGAVPRFPANNVVTISPKLGAFVDPTLRYTLGLTVFAYLPPS